MLVLRKSQDRGHAQHGGIASAHSFSFASYQDPNHRGFGPLVVLNEDRVQPGQGFGAHGHANMEIVSCVLSGALAHKDSLGNGSVLRAGDVQRMTAGTGVRHSEANASSVAPVHFLQIWLLPSEQNLRPGYEERHVTDASKQGQLRLIASPDGVDAVKVHQDAWIYATRLDQDDRLAHALRPGRGAYVHVVQGSVVVNGQALSAGDALKVTDEPQVQLRDGRQAEVLVFDLPYP